MELERIGVVLRPRVTREALDLGAAMLRAHARPVWSAWFAFTLPLFVLCNGLGVALGWPWLGWGLMWWLKPLFDRLPLYVLSRAVFDQAPGWRQTLRGQARWPWRRTLAALTWLRIDSNRALRLPLDLLEGSTRAQRSARWKVLRRRLVGETSLLTYFCLLFELVLFLSVWLFALLLIPHEWRPQSLIELVRGDTQVIPTAWVLAGAGVAYLAMSVIEPLYVACGFALYLNRRTQLEAWDIDLAFRRLRARLQGTALLAIALLCFGAWTPPAQAQATAEVHAAAVDKPASVSLDALFGARAEAPEPGLAQAAARAYRDPRFGGEHTVRRWQLKYKPEPAATSINPLFPWLGHLLGGFFQLLLWLLLIGVLGGLIWLGWRWRGRWLLRDEEVAPALSPPISSIVDAPAALPADLAGAARALWQAQRRREALALLYRGCVEQTARELRQPPAADATEAHWLRQARAIDDPQRSRRVIEIVRTWQFAAYAGRYPDDATVEQLLAGWPAQPGAST
ncbi:MAG: DUF4129 domain-containing protein [Rhodanobacter sp. SCN 67-45]|nr:MAG: DUF4129 domain-containing protein [Rhodanobacter sp. SCN 67-45]